MCLQYIDETSSNINTRYVDCDQKFMGSSPLVRPDLAPDVHGKNLTSDRKLGDRITNENTLLDQEILQRASVTGSTGNIVFFKKESGVIFPSGSVRMSPKCILLSSSLLQRPAATIYCRRLCFSKCSLDFLSIVTLVTKHHMSFQWPMTTERSASDGLLGRHSRRPQG